MKLWNRGIDRNRPKESGGGSAASQNLPLIAEPKSAVAKRENRLLDAILGKTNENALPANKYGIAEKVEETVGKDSIVASLREKLDALAIDNGEGITAKGLRMLSVLEAREKRIREEAQEEIRESILDNDQSARAMRKSLMHLYKKSAQNGMSEETTLEINRLRMQLKLRETYVDAALKNELKEAAAQKNAAKEKILPGEEALPQNTEDLQDDAKAQNADAAVRNADAPPQAISYTYVAATKSEEEKGEVDEEEATDSCVQYISINPSGMGFDENPYSLPASENKQAEEGKKLEAGPAGELDINRFYFDEWIGDSFVSECLLPKHIDLVPAHEKDRETFERVEKAIIADLKKGGDGNIPLSEYEEGAYERVNGSLRAQVGLFAAIERGTRTKVSAKTQAELSNMLEFTLALPEAMDMLGDEAAIGALQELNNNDYARKSVSSITFEKKEHNAEELAGLISQVKDPMLMAALEKSQKVSTSVTISDAEGIAEIMKHIPPRSISDAVFLATATKITVNGVVYEQEKAIDRINDMPPDNIFIKSIHGRVHSLRLDGKGAFAARPADDERYIEEVRGYLKMLEVHALKEANPLISAHGIYWTAFMNKKNPLNYYGVEEVQEMLDGAYQPGMTEYERGLAQNAPESFEGMMNRHVISNFKLNRELEAEGLIVAYRQAATIPDELFIARRIGSATKTDAFVEEWVRENGLGEFAKNYAPAVEGSLNPVEITAKLQYQEVFDLYVKDYERGQTLTAKDIYHLLAETDNIASEKKVLVGKSKILRKNLYKIENVYEKKTNALPHTEESVAKTCETLSNLMLQYQLSGTAMSDEEQAHAAMGAQIRDEISQGVKPQPSQDLLGRSVEGAAVERLVPPIAREVAAQIEEAAPGISMKFEQEIANGTMHTISQDAPETFEATGEKYGMHSAHNINERSIIAMANSGMSVHEIAKIFESEDAYNAANNTCMKVQKGALRQVRIETEPEKLAAIYTRLEIGRILREARTMQEAKTGIQGIEYME